MSETLKTTTTGTISVEEDAKSDLEPCGLDSVAQRWQSLPLDEGARREVVRGSKVLDMASWNELSVTAIPSTSPAVLRSRCKAS